MKIDIFDEMDEETMATPPNQQYKNTNLSNFEERKNGGAKGKRISTSFEF